MALLTAGTAATTSLSALLFKRSGMSATDVAALRALIKQYNVNGTPTLPGAFEEGLLYLPNDKGVIRLNAGDYILVDGAGYPTAVPSSIFATSWVHS